MALISCPECKQQVSTEAVACPHCGKQLSGVAAAGPVAGSPLFSSAAPGPEQVLWEGGPSIALVYGKIARVVIRCVILFVIAIFRYYHWAAGPGFDIGSGEFIHRAEHDRH